MGSTRISFLTLVTMLLVITPFAKSADMPQTERKDIYENVDQLREWAAQYYLGGFELQSFEFGEKKVAVVIGQPTSGAVTSEVFVYSSSEWTQGRLGFTLHRARLFGIVRAKKDDQRLLFLVTGKPNEQRLILILPISDL